MAARLFTGAALLVTALAIPAPQLVSYSGDDNSTVIPTNGTVENNPISNTYAEVLSPKPTSYGGNSGSFYHSPAWLPHGQALRPHLSQQQTNGQSKLGTWDAPKLPYWLSGSPMPNGRPWGSRTAKNCDPYTNPPETGVTRHYDFVITSQTCAPDGVEKDCLVINGAFPGPTIEANWGDWIEVVVHNGLGTEGTSMHWHGLLQTATPWMDGVPSVQQCPIAPGSTFTYRFKADLYGTSWYHSHYSAQYAGGLLGAMIIYGPHDNYQYDEDLGPVLISDWYHGEYFSLVEDVMRPAADGVPPPSSQNNLINGKMNYPCQNATAGVKCTPNAGVSKFAFESGKKYRLRLINAGAEGIQKFAIDGHKMTVIANDFVPVEPYEVDVVTLGIGQRTDIVVEATGQPTDAVWMRSTLGKSAFVGGCTLNDGISPEAVAAIYYQNANKTAVPTTQSEIPEDIVNRCSNDALSQTVPYYEISPPARPSSTEQIDITFQSNGTHNLWYMNNSTFRADYNDPLLLEAKLGRRDFDPEWNVFDFGNSDSIRLVIYNHAQAGAHPMHMHGHNMYILAVGSGTWDGSIVNPSNPQRRDVQLLPNAVDPSTPSYIVVQIDADNPGVWPFHCHIAWHVSAGLYINILEKPRDIQRKMNIPSSIAQTCRDWSAWSGNNVVPEIDSGL